MAVDLACGLKEKGLRPIVIALDNGGVLERRLIDAGIEFVVLGGRRFLQPQFHSAYAQYLRRSGVSVVHTHMFAPLLHSLPAVKGARVRRLIHTEHSFEYLEPRKSYRIALRAMSTLTDRFTVVGERMRPYYLDRIGISARKLRVIPNGVTVTARSTAPEREQIRAELGLPSKAVLLGAAGRLAPEKNLEFLLHALSRAAESVPTLHLVLLGEGECRNRLEALTKELGINSSVSFLGWRTDVRRVLDALDIYVLTSISEGLPLAMLEGMAAELPIVSTAVGDVPNLVKEGETGFLIPQNDIEGLAARLAQLARQPELRASMGRSARQLLMQSYDRSSMIERYIDAYGL